MRVIVIRVSPAAMVLSARGVAPYVFDAIGRSQAIPVVMAVLHQAPWRGPARCRMPENRGSTTAHRHLAPSVRDLMPDPFCLRDMEAATDRLKRAVA